MGSVATLSIGGYPIEWTKNGVDPWAMSVFTERDRVARVVDMGQVDAASAPEIPDAWSESDVLELPDGLAARVTYRATARAVADRLEAMGVGLDAVRASIERHARERATLFEDEACAEDALGQGESDAPRSLTFDEWASAFREVSAPCVAESPPSHDEEALSPVARYLADDADADAPFGVPGGSRRLLRAVTAACAADSVVEYDLSDLVAGGWVGLQQRVAEESIGALRSGARHDAPLIVLTEGSTDASLLASSLELLYPHLVGYVSFADLRAANAAGGASALVATVRAFAAAGVVNRTVALFDNDAAGHAALKMLGQTPLPESMRAMALPPLGALNQYPTRGPNGPGIQDVNGRAASLELYLGDEVLRGGGQDLPPVEWRSREPAVNDWQGEVVGKREIQARFRERVRIASTDASVLAASDWSGVRLIIDGILRASADLAATQEPSSGARSGRA